MLPDLSLLKAGWDGKGQAWLATTRRAILEPIRLTIHRQETLLQKARHRSLATRVKLLLSTADQPFYKGTTISGVLRPL